MGSVALHELYFGNLGGEGNKIPDPVGGHPRDSTSGVSGPGAASSCGRDSPSPMGPAGSR